MRILLIGFPRSSGTGAFVYCHALAQSLKCHHNVVLAQSPLDIKKDWDLIHLLDPKFAPPLATLKQRNAPLILDLHDHYWAKVDYPVSDWPLRRWMAWRRRKRYQRLFSMADLIVTHSQSVLATVGHPHTVCLPYGLPPLFEKKEEREGESLFQSLENQRKNQTKKEIVFIGRDGLRKGLSVLIKALRILIHHDSDFEKNLKLTVIGREYPHARFLLSALGKGLPVRFMGEMPRNGAMDYLKRADLFVLPSHTEAFGIVLLEALALSVPIVATRVGGIPEVIRDGIDGLLVPPNHPIALAEAMEKVLRHPELALKLKNNGPVRVADFDWSKMIEGLEKIYTAHGHKLSFF